MCLKFGGVHIWELRIHHRGHLDMQQFSALPQFTSLGDGHKEFSLPWEAGCKSQAAAAQILVSA